MFYSIEECRNILLQFGQRDISPSVVAHVLGMMAKTPSALSDQPGQVIDLKLSVESQSVIFKKNILINSTNF
jgi:hypothetical protein